MKRIHDLAKLKVYIKANAEEARGYRDAAQKVTGEDRWALQQDARDIACTQRHELLAFGYLRGKDIDDMESPYTRLDNLPEPSLILAYARAVFMKGPDAEPWSGQVPVEDNRTFWQKLRGKTKPKSNQTVDHPDWAEFKRHVEADLTQWADHVQGTHSTREHRREQAEQVEQVEEVA